jgi:hypothetical protein
MHSNRYIENILQNFIIDLNADMIWICSLLKKFHAAMRSSTATRELTTDLRGTGKSIPKLSSIAA